MRLMMLTAALAAFSFPALAADKGDKEVKPGSFLTEALGNATALERFSALAQTKANDEEVKKFAKKVGTEAKECREKLVEIAKDSKVGLVLGLEKGRQTALAKMSVRTGKEFDRAYIAQTLKDLQDSMDVMKKHAKSSDAKVKGLCADGMKKCKDGLAWAKKIQARIGKPDEEKKETKEKK